MAGKIFLDQPTNDWALVTEPPSGLESIQVTTESYNLQSFIVEVVEGCSFRMSLDPSCTLLLGIISHEGNIE
jgi:hypothetical protein